MNAESINQIGQAALVWLVVISGLWGALRGSGLLRKVVESKAATTAGAVLTLLENVARVAVQATEQQFRKAAPPRGQQEAEEIRRQKADLALGRFFQLLPTGMEVEISEARGLIEGAVHALNTEQAHVDPQ